MGDSAAGPPLLLDAMLGRLARWLRLIGYDAAYIADTDDLEVVRAARAESRLVLTRDRNLAARRAIDALLIESQTLDEQIEQVVGALGLPPRPARPRCGVCNVPLEGISPEAARSRVPPYVWRTETDFSECPACRRVYWPGTHWQSIQARLARRTQPETDAGAKYPPPPAASPSA